MSPISSCDRVVLRIVAQPLEHGCRGSVCLLLDRPRQLSIHVAIRRNTFELPHLGVTEATVVDRITIRNDLGFPRFTKEAEHLGQNGSWIASQILVSHKMET